jgi:hypothetical protein
MSVSALSSVGASSASLVKLANGEYTADSVAKDQADALKLDLVKETDGNYGTTPPAPANSAASVQSSSNVLANLASLKLGGK